MNCDGPGWIRVYFDASENLTSAPALSGRLNIVNHSLIKPSGLNIWVFWTDCRQTGSDPASQSMCEIGRGTCYAPLPGQRMGRVTLNWEPLPEVLLTSMRPCDSTMLLASDRPRPCLRAPRGEEGLEDSGQRLGGNSLTGIDNLQRVQTSSPEKSRR